MKISIIIRQISGEVWRVHSPSLPGCTVEAATMEDAQDKMGVAIAAYISSLDAASPSRIDLDRTIERNGCKPHGATRSLAW